MKRKKWSEFEERTLITKYSELQNSGTLAKLRNREKKMKPIADHVNSLHHLQDPITFPFNWSWRDVSIKVQNMRHQYLGVKQKIRVSDGGFNWDDGDNHWENFIKYKEVFGDVELQIKENGIKDSSSNVEDLIWGNHGEGELGLGFEMIDFDEFEEDEEEEEEGSSSIPGRNIVLLGAKVLELREMLVKREDKRKGRDFARDEISILREESRLKMGRYVEKGGMIRDERAEERQLELEEMQIRLLRRELDRQLRELDEERRWNMKMNEKREAEEMEWRERMLGLQLDHEKQMMQMNADASQNKMQIVGIIAGFMCQYFGPATDGLGGIHPQVLQHPRTAALGEDIKPGSHSPPQFV